MLTNQERLQLGSSDLNLLKFVYDLLDEDKREYWEEIISTSRKKTNIVASMQELKTEFNSYDLQLAHHESENFKIATLRKNLEVLDICKDFGLLGHGTSVECAKGINESGLRSKTNEFNSTAVVVFDDLLAYEDLDNGWFEQFINWPHHGLKAITIIAIPHPPAGQKSGFSYYNSVFEKIDKTDTPTGGYGSYFFIPPQFIRGYIDVETLTFVENEKFSENATVVYKEDYDITDIDFPPDEYYKMNLYELNKKHYSSGCWFSEYDPE